MSQINEMLEYEEKTRAKYSHISKLLFLIGIIIVLWVIVIFSGIFFWNYGYDWALISFENWLLASSVIIGILILFEIFLFVKYSSLKTKVEVVKKPERIFPV